MPTPATLLIQSCEAGDPMADIELTNDQAAAFLGIAPQTLVVWRMQGRSPPSYKVGRSVMYLRRVLEEFRSQRCPYCWALLGPSPSLSASAPNQASPAEPVQKPQAKPVLHLKLRG